MFSDEELLDFDASNMANYSPERALAALEEFGDAYRFQLVMARHLAGWADRREQSTARPTSPRPA